MISSIFLAQVIGLYFVIVSIAMLKNKEYFQQVIAGLSQQKGVLLLSAFVSLILGILLVLSHNMWVSNWQVIITIIAWLVFIKGSMRFLFPGVVDKCNKYVASDRGYYISVVVTLAIGAYLVYMGFFGAA